MKIKLSNTGRSITISFPRRLYKHRFIVSYEAGRVRLQPTSHPREGLRVCSGASSIVISSRKFLEWPHHGLIERETFTVADDPDCYIVRVFDADAGDPSDSLPSPFIRQRRLKRAERVPAVPAAFAPAGQANVVLIINDKTYSFRVPANQLLDTVLDWCTKGYSSA